MKSKDKGRSWMENYAPPGINLAQEVHFWIMTMIISTIWSLYFIVRYFEERGMLYETIAGERYLREGALMPSFEDLITGRFEVFYLVIIYCIIIAAYHYFYHYQGSKMMYLMRRLPNKWEVHIRCLSLPICAGVIAVIELLILKMLYYAIYILCTPTECLML